MHYFVKIKYLGTHFHGFQVQPELRTVQGVLGDALQVALGVPCKVTGCSRTDAGVHALCQVANFKCQVDMTCTEIMDYLNHYLPEDVKVTSINEVDERFHSRLNAVSKTYEYSIATTKPDVFIRKYVYAVEDVPDTEKMRKTNAFQFLP